MAICKCDEGLINSGIPSCTSGFGRIVRLIFAYRNAFDGTSNAIPVTTTIDATFIDGKINNADVSKRWYPSDYIYSVAEERATPVTETIDNINLNVTQGTRTFLGQFINTASATPTYLKFLKSLECPALMYFGVDENGNIVGVDNGDGALDGIYIQQKSIYSRPISATATSIAKNELGFSLDTLVKDENISFMETDNINFSTVNGLIDVVLTEGTLSGAWDYVTVLGTFVYGAANNKLHFKGATDLADWVVYNVTTSSAVVITAVDLFGGADNNYKLSFTAQTSGDVLRVSVAKTGFESKPIEITLP